MNSAKGVVVSIVPTFSQRGSLWGKGTFSAETLRRRLTFRSLDRESWSCSEGFTDPFEFMVHDNRDDQTVGVADPSELYRSKSLCPFVTGSTTDPCRNRH